MHICFNLPFYRRGHQSPKNLDNGPKVAHPVSARTTSLEASLLACKGLGVAVCPARTVLNIQHLLCMCLCSQWFPSDTSPGSPRPYCPCCKSSCDSSCRRLCSGPAHCHQQPGATWVNCALHVSPDERESFQQLVLDSWGWGIIHLKRLVNWM